ncbi:MAG: PEP-CTERM sorting domain-containing protein [Luteolibacter sp.]
MINPTFLLTSVATLALVQVSSAASFIWNGNANDGDWANTANWAGGTAPASLTSSPANTIEFSGTNMPTLNLATFNGTLNPGAILVFNSGGTFGLDMASSFQSGYISTAGGTVITVGNGISGGTENVTLNISNAATLLRHASVTMNYLVNSDGALNFSSALNLYADNNKNATFTINGGSVSSTGLIDNRFNNLAGSFFDFTAVGGSLTAKYGGGAFADFAAVQADASGIFKNNSGGTLQFTDNGSSFFTVKAVPEPSSMAILIGGIGMLALRRRRVD